MLRSKKFWYFDICKDFNLTNEILSGAKSKGKFYEDTLYFYDLIGTGVHPSIKKLQKNSSVLSVMINK